MTLPRLPLAGALALVLACGSDGIVGPGSITITVNQVPARTNAASLQIAGQVTRTPADPNQRIAVTVTKGGTSQTDTASASGAFLFSITLTLNAANQITVTATDASGSTAASVTVTVVHDNQGPAVSQVTPVDEADGVNPAAVQVTFNEPVRLGSGPALRVLRQGVAVAGTVSLSADSLTLSFTPAVPFFSNGIHVVSVGSLLDDIGNTSPGRSTCFVTGGAGASFSDPAADVWQAGTPPPQLVPADLLELRLARANGELRGLLRFDSRRSLDPNVGSNIFAVIDFDMDQDGNTGFTTVKDTVFVPPGVLPPSGARAEYTVWLVPLPDSSFAAQYTEPLNGPINFRFIPDLCGTYLGFAVPEAALGSDDGAFDIVGYTDAFLSNGVYIDPTPDNGVHSANLTVVARGVTQPLVDRPVRGTIRAEARGLILRPLFPARPSR